ncbi:glutathione S-transferase family protein [Ponticaulis sp.]|uniref:glutathione S-transferase family protein n=1 Tax=Ponticaulis sp. TaxID=2020902 RepID=UPI000B695678|nr:glutathione S-transferase family protein [Ponticaulis sp.]MAI90601.1 glutathione S-transferase [Ponticaulis sp.]OUX99114.1 MAG: glutathione S-transferase [Hyphomonadaceae bacterium TMED5]|tara:strand:+ start:101318 stop:101932 length:615 start_codon:yes stop_codon:yes gene_type:complete
MKLIGMLDSPFVRRVAVTMKLLELPFEHESVSVMRDYETFRTYNPLVKAPTLIMDDGTILMESSLILELVEKLAGPGQGLMPEGLDDYVRAQRIIGLSLIAAEKTVQKVYEHNMRASENIDLKWLSRVETQLADAYRALNAELKKSTDWSCGPKLTQADITAAIAWKFTEHVFPKLADDRTYPAIAALSERAEAIPEFIDTPLE